MKKVVVLGLVLMMLLTGCGVSFTPSVKIEKVLEPVTEKEIVEPVTESELVAEDGDVESNVYGITNYDEFVAAVPADVQESFLASSVGDADKIIFVNKGLLLCHGLES